MGSASAHPDDVVDGMIVLEGCDGGRCIVGKEIRKYSKIIDLILDPQCKIRLDDNMFIPNIADGFEESRTNVIRFPYLR